MSIDATENHTYVDGYKIVFREQGEGNTVILLHGIPTNSLMWRDIIPQLAKNHRVIAPDLLNYGQSEKPLDADVSINAQSRIIIGLMNALGIPYADVVAHDIGGGIAQLMAVSDAQRVRKLVLLDSICFDSWPIPEFEPLQKPGAETDMGLDEFIGMMRDFMPNGVQDKSVMTDEIIDLYVSPWSTEDGKHAFFRNLRRLNKEYTEAIADELKHLPHQTLVLWGDKDAFQKPAYAPQLTKAIPNAELVWIKDAGHWLIEEKPEEVGKRIGDFLG
ncbi:Pimeloyl-ACP methyl ester carboxylesterase [Modicisalibacter ilicicola DSM 19980]|uniref:Pimeloyl-ACP methyl ester carboxylesterase n=1 Tax=Modicisalibacter ilicicola DSM 19980 TaxID=1121942 RepID=A0A1M4ZVV1_9GAMM|nr:alpha/beta hydrolase [Halomonas ilicicola]SHF22141.1 Pimeloyl-ACP methyl ester carboxylesterase [Halomonas ilicicola DSM 19980]